MDSDPADVYRRLRRQHRRRHEAVPADDPGQKPAGGAAADGPAIRAALVFSALYFLLLILFSALVSLDGVDIATSFTAALSCLSNIGPGMTGAIGPAGSFALFTDRTKLLLTLAMLLGRLELYPILLLFSPRTWKS